VVIVGCILINLLCCFAAGIVLWALDVQHFNPGCAQQLDVRRFYRESSTGMITPLWFVVEITTVGDDILMIRSHFGRGALG
jgi:hypothetical protein